MGARTAGLCLLGAWACSVFTGQAHADEGEIERRLRAAAVPRTERLRVHASLDRAVAFLAREQMPDGGFPVADGQGYVLAAPLRNGRIEATALATLALLHVDTEAARESAARALVFLVKNGKIPRHELLYRVVPAALTVLALSAADRHPELAHELSRRIQGAQDKQTGYWDHAMRNGAASRGNLPASHFAALALHAGARQDVGTWEWVWRNHLNALDSAGRLRGWTYGPQDKHRGSYPAAVCMALANRVLARSALLKAELIPANALLHNTKDRAALDVAGASVLELLRGERVRSEWQLRAQPTDASPRTESLFDLLALSTAALFQGRESVGGESWFASGSELLLGRQNDDGGWGRTGRLATAKHSASDVAETSFGLLFLTRAATVYRPNNPGRVHLRDIARSPFAPNGPDAQLPRDPSQLTAEDEPAPTRVMAWALLRELEQLLDSEEDHADLLLASVDDVRFAYRVFDPATRTSRTARDDAVAWRRGAELLLLRAVEYVPPQPVRGRPAVRSVRRAGVPAQSVQVAAADALGSTHVRVSAPLRNLLERAYLAKGTRPAPAGLLTAAFGALSRLGDANSAAWIIEHGVLPGKGGVAEARTRAALVAVGRLHNISGKQRLLLCWNLLRRYARKAGATENGKPPIRREPQRSYALDWPPSLRPALLRALRHLSLDPQTDQIPGLDRWTSSLSDLETWLRFHDDPADAPWAASNEK